MYQFLQSAHHAPLITLEEHYQAPALADLPHNAAHYTSFPQHLKGKLRDLGSQRIADMDTSSVSMQVMSHGPGIGNASQCRSANETLAAAAVKRNPTRFAGFETLPIGEPENAAKELEYCVKELGFAGALVENLFEGRFYNDETFWPVFEWQMNWARCFTSTRSSLLATENLFIKGATY